MDAHSGADVARGVASALDAAKGEVQAAQAGRAPAAAVLGLMRQLCAQHA
jgi:hypothetical protein